MNIKSFRDPGSIYRAAPFWSWNDKLDANELKRQISEMADKGWGGYFMHSRVGLVTEYLSPEWMDMIRTCAKQAKKTNTYAWLYDEDKWPSGFAGGKVSENEEYRSRALVLLKQDQVSTNDTVLREYEQNGDKYYICKRVSPLGNAWFNGMCYVDLMNPEAVKAFIECTHEKYKKECGEYFGKEIPGIFTDEPCYLMEGHYNVPVLPWSDYLPQFFYKLKGYSIEEYLTELFFDVNDYHKVRYDFFDSATHLFLESFTKQYYEWCDKNNLKMTGHFMAEDTLTSQLQWVGAAMPHYEFMHWPGIDKLGRHIEQLVTVKQVTSAADQLHKERTFCEVFGCVGQQVSFYHRKWIADWQAALGINFVNHHLSLYSMRGERKRDYPANLYYQQPWWEDEKKFADYIGRLSYTLSQGKRDVDILVIHPIGSVWSEYSPIHKKNNLAIEHEVYDRPFDILSKALIANKLDFHYGDELIMQNHAKVENGKIVIGQHSYSTIIIPPSLTLRQSTVDLLTRFANEAGAQNIIMVKPYASRIDGNLKVIDWADGIIAADTVYDAVAAADARYPNRIKIIDEITERNAEEIICHVRSTDLGKIVFISNTDENREVNVHISISETLKPVIMDLMSGQLYDCPAKLSDNHVELDAKLYPSGSIMLLFPEEKTECLPTPEYLDTGIAFKDNYTAQCVIKDWNVNVLDQNVLPINDITLYLDGKLVLDNKPISKAWHNLFYNAKDGTPFKAEYSFDVINVPEGEVFAVVEVAENLDSITFNGTKVQPLKSRGELGAFDSEKSWKDINFTKVPITGLVQQGRNTLAIEGIKVNNITGPGTHVGVDNFKEHMATEAEVVYIVGDFTVVNDDNIRFAIDGNITAPIAADLTKTGYTFYAGRAEFTSDIKYDSDKAYKTYLKLNDVNAACVELYVNGKFCNAKYWAPYVFDITEFLNEGRNEIKVIAPSTLFNLMGPNRIQGIKDMQGIGPHTFVAHSRFTEKYAFFPFGIGSAVVFK